MSGGDTKDNLRRTLWNALALDANLYENAANNSKTHRLALTIVILAAVSRALGSSVILLISVTKFPPLPILVLAVVIDVLSVVLGYYFWTLTIWKIGQWLRPNHAKYGDLLSPIGFAYATQVLNFLTVIPLLGEPIQLALAVWSLLAVIVAVRQGLDISNRTSTLICLVGWPLVQIAIGSVQRLELMLLSRFSG